MACFFLLDIDFEGLSALLPDYVRVFRGGF